MNGQKILIVEDNRALSVALAAAVSQAGVESELVATAQQAKEVLRKGAVPFTGMILDIGLPDENGLSFLESLPLDCRPPTIIITAHGELENTILARKLGGLEFFTKPIDFDGFRDAVGRMVNQARGIQTTTENSAAYIGAATSMRPVFQQMAHACASNVPVLVTGAIGTGKSLTANLIQRNGPPNTGARTFHPPVDNQVEPLEEALESTQRGVLIIDDLEDLNMATQTELIRNWERAPESFPRILAICRSNLRQEVERGEFRSDLFYRLQVLEVRLPTLRDRIEDLPALFSFFLAQMQPGRGLTVENSTLHFLQRYTWPGNLRELRNVASFAITTCSSGLTVSPQHLPEHILKETPISDHNMGSKLDHAIDHWLKECGELDCYRKLAESLERKLIQQLLLRFDGKLARLANSMNANRSTLRKKLKVSKVNMDS